MDIENEIQSWIAVRSFAVEDANPQAPIIDANELAEFVTEVFKKLEGCVVVPVQCPDPDFADSLFDELSKKAIGEFGDDLLIHFSDIDEEKIWALMVEAAKAQAVPEGFVLVPVDTLEECLNWAHIAKWDSPSNEVDKKIAHHEAIIESAISAQEPTND